jgi:hypothetical protein
MFAGRLRADEFLGSIQPEVVSMIAKAAAEMVSSRRYALLQFVI